MLDPSRPALTWFIWSIWPSLSWLERLSFLALCATGAYWLFWAVTVLRSQNLAGDLNSTPSDRASLLRTRKRIRNGQQATTAAFYLVGFALFVCLHFAYMALGESRMAMGWMIVENFQIHFAFAANAFLVLLFIQCIQWFVTNRVRVIESNPL
ncbi:MAG TPA: hypothetical protein VFP59_17275 [Candidatus Angelobacter sp.]|nr:hypothetical protein [Candidatus Angelobacter sp.]